MEINEIKNILKEGNKIAFGPKEKSPGLGLYEIVFDKKDKAIRFTTDTPRFTKDKTIEEATDIIYSKFKIKDKKIVIHEHPGKIKDKDIFLFTDNKEAEIIKFIQDNFYENDEEWAFQILD